MYNNMNQTYFNSNAMGGQGYYAPQNQMVGNPALYGQQQQPINYTNPISDKEANELMAKGNGGIKVEITNEQYREGICTHKTSKGPACYELPDGRWKCKICGAEWEMIEDVDKEAIQQAVDNVHNIMHTAKFMWADIPVELCKDYFQVLPVVDQMPKIFDIASDRYAKTVGAQPNGMNPVYQNGTQNSFALLGQITGHPMGYGYGTPIAMGQQYQQPAMMPGYQQPMPGYQQPVVYNQQPANIPQMTPMQQAMVGDGMNMPGYQQQPVQQAAPQQQPAQTVNAAPQSTTGEATVTNTLSV